MRELTRLPEPTRRHRRRFVGLALIGSAAVLVAIANVPVTSRQGVNYEVSTHRLPLYVKGIEFIDRDVQYRQLAGEATRGLATDSERVLAAYNWTLRNIRPTPDGWKIVDDHILNIIIRGHGEPDQRADVFAMLATYAGVPAFWKSVKAPGTTDGVVLSFARVDGRWAVFDVANQVMFRNDRGYLATAEDVAANPELIPDAARSLTVGSTPYLRFFARLRTPPVPRPLRAELQMPSRRLWHEVSIALRLEHNDES